MGDVEARLARLEDEREILRTLHRYGQSIDYGDEAAWVDCFAEDGVFDVRSPRGHGLNRLVSGREELRRFISRHSRAPDLWHKHLLVEPLIEIDRDEATCSSYLAVVMEHESRPVLRVFGRYRDRLVRCDDGRWRLKHRIAEVESMRPGLPPFVDARPGLPDPAPREH